jgi:PAS domain S-box-containing protein
VGDLILLIDTSGNIVNVNERSWDMLGYHPSEMIGRHVLELNVFDKGEASKVAALLTEAIEQGKFGNRLLEIQARHRDGHIVPVEISSARLFSEGQIKGFLSIIRDITERKQAEEELAKVKRDADAKIIQSAKLASLGEMAAGIAHEINQPLNVIKMTTTGILDFIDEGKEVQQEMLKSELEKTDRQVERMRGVIDHMRTFSRRSAALLLEPVDMNVPLRDAFSMIGQQLKLREIEVQRDLQELPKVLADSNKLEQVFLNLITNARDAMDELAQTAEEGHKKILKVRSFVEDGKATVTISDTGGGIPEQQRQRVFEPFFTTKDPGKGTGLGLSISYNIIKEFKGIIDFIVQEGAGTTFKVAIPIAQSNDTNSGTQGHD